MLYVAIGSLWVVSIICMLFLAAYIYQLTRRQLDNSNNSYFWTVLRTVIVFCLGLSIFYFGVANRVESLPKLVAYRLQVRQIPLWSAEAWVSLSLAFSLCGMLFALTDTLRHKSRSPSAVRLKVRDFKVPLLPFRLPYGVSLAHKQSEPLEAENSSKRYFSQADQFWALANVLVGLFTGCFLFVGLQAVSQINFVQALGINGEFSPRTAFNQRLRPTPTSNISSNPISILQERTSNDENAANSGNAAEADGVAQAPLEVATRSVQQDGQPVIQEAAEQLAATTRQPSSAPSSNLQSETTPASAADAGTEDNAQPETAVADIPQPPNDGLNAAPPETVVFINEPLGVNARTGPGVTFGVITILQNGTQHTLLQRSSDGQWLNIVLPGATDGWVASWVVDVSP